MHKILYSLVNHKVKNVVAILNAVYFLLLRTIILPATYKRNTSVWEWTYSLVSSSATALYVLII